jgi:hypothetical protein
LSPPFWLQVPACCQSGADNCTRTLAERRWPYKLDAIADTTHPTHRLPGRYPAKEYIMEIFNYRGLKLINASNLSDFERFVTHRTAHLRWDLGTAKDAPPPADGMYVALKQGVNYKGLPQWQTFGHMTALTLAEVDAWIAQDE